MFLLGIAGLNMVQLTKRHDCDLHITRLQSIELNILIQIGYKPKIKSHMLCALS